LSTKPVGNFTFVLHTHLPYVLAHGRWPHGMDWLCEATAETYIPLLNVFYQLVEEGISPGVTIGLTPVLTEQLADPSFKEEFNAYLEQKIQAAIHDQDYFSHIGEQELANLARFWQEHFTRVLTHFKERYRWNLVEAFRKLQDEGHIEIITCAATHGYLPLLSLDTSVQAQVKQGIATYRRHFGRQPRGFWLPECAYRPRYNWAPPLETKSGHFEPYLRKGVEEFLAENGIEYFIIDSHLLKGGEAIGVYIDRFEALKRLWGQFASEYQARPEETEKSPYRAYLVNSSGEPKAPVAILTRDPQTGIQVWSGEHGYPGDEWYLDFHKKHFPGGHRYWRVTSAKSDLADKRIYEPHRAMERVPDHARHFAWLVKEVLKGYQSESNRPGMLCAPYDTELFGHWWFEGPQWLYRVLKEIALDPEVNLATGSAILEADPPATVVSLPEGSWGQGGFHWIWLNEWTQWTWRHIYEAEAEMQALASELGDHEEIRPVLKQAARELFLLQASDWQFLMSTWTARDYAEARIDEHYRSFMRLARLARKQAAGEPVSPAEWEFLHDCEERDNLFPDVDVSWFSRLEYPPSP